MALQTKTIRLKRSTRLALDGAFLAGAGKDERLPIGILSGDNRRHRAYARLADNRFPSDFWDSMYRIERVELWAYKVSYFRVTDGSGSGRVRIRRATAGQTEGTSDTLSSTNGGGAVWPGPATHAGTEVRSATLASGTNKWVRVAVITTLTKSWWATRLGGSNDTMHGIVIAQDNDDWTSTPGYTSTADNVEFASDDWGNGSKAMELRFVYEDNQPPTAPTIRSPEPGGNPTVVATTSGKELTVEFDFNDADDSVCAKAELEVYPDAITDATAEGTTPTATTGSITPTGTATARRYKVRLTGLPARTNQRFRLRTLDPGGTVWGPWTSLASGRIKTAYSPGTPLNPAMAKNPLANSVSATISSLDSGDYVTGMWVKAWRDLVTGPFLLWDSGIIDAGDGSSRSATESWGGRPVVDGDKIRWRIALVNRDDILSPFTDDITTTLKTQVGPTITPASEATKLLSRTAAITFTFSESTNGYQFRLYRDGVQIHDSGLVAFSAATSVAPTLPSGLVNWGETLEIEAAGRPVSTGILGDFSPRSKLYVNELPTTVTTAGDGDVEDATVVPTTDVLWSSPYSGHDVDVYGEVPVAKDLTIYASGVAILRRVSTSQIVADERTGRRLDTLTSATGWVADSNVTATTAATAPTGYTGNSLAIQGTGASSSDRGARYTFATPLDLSVFSGGALFRIHRRITSVTNLTRAALRFEFATSSDWAEFELAPSGATINTWEEVVEAKANPRATNGTVDWSNVEAIYVLLDVSGAYTGDLQLRDLRLGLVQTAKATPDGNIVPEATVNGRVRYLDNATAALTTTLAAAAAAGATNVKLTSVTSLFVGSYLTILTAGRVEVRTVSVVGTAGAGGTGVDLTSALQYDHLSGVSVRHDYWGPWSSFVSVKASLPPAVAANTPADKTLVADPTPSLVHTFSSPGGKAQASRTTRLYRRAGQAKRVIASGAATLLRMSESSGNLADSIGAVVGTASGGITYGVTGATHPADTNTAVELNGTSGYFSLGDVFDFTGTASFSVALWVRPDSAASVARILSKEHATDGGWRLRYGTDTAIQASRIDNGLVADQTASVLLPVGQLARVVITYDGATLSLYLDGELGGTVASTRSLTNHANALHVGRYAPGATGFFAGLVDELAFWNRALSAAEVAADFAAADETPGDELAYTLEATGTGLTDTLPTLLLADAAAYAWEKDAYDTDGLDASTTRRSFLTQFTTPSAVANLTATADADTSGIALAWTASADTYFDHYRVYWRDQAGQYVRIDTGPIAVDDEREKLTDAAFTWHGGRLGANEFLVTVHNGTLESEPTPVAVTLERPSGVFGQWMLVVEDENRYTLPLMVLGAPRTHTATIETFRPPGRSHPLHLHWGSSGRSVSLATRYRPDDHGDLLSPLAELHASGTAFWIKAPSGYQWDVMRARIVGLSDAVEPYGFVALSVEIDEVDREDV